ncbi:Galectin-4 [Eumeta japonica]|uniref:Galectin n=1 Tax=Eumeta variegata TaxID=151549 RepID=A0A4C1XKI0_EUMVA|nr:Galectin-4 [Eumeta japonica]
MGTPRYGDSAGAVKCIHQFPGGVFPGKAISFRATTPPGAYRFTINLQCGPNTDSNDDIAFHFNVRFPDGCVVRNHRTANTWGPEERAGGLPIRQGVAFQARILYGLTSFKVSLNSIHFCEFFYRLPFQRITHITFGGDVTLTSINFEGAQPQPQPPSHNLSKMPRDDVRASAAAQDMQASNKCIQGT